MNARLKHIEFEEPGSGPRWSVILVARMGQSRKPHHRRAWVCRRPPSTGLNYLSTRFRGQTIEVQLFMKLEMDTLRRELDEVSAKIVETGIAVWSGESDADSKTLIVRGQANLLENTKAFDELEKIRKLFEDIENKKELVQLLGAAEGGEGVRIFIGSENKLFSMSGSSLIVAPYKNSDEKIVGVLGIIGPTRMNYARIIPMVDYTAKVVPRLLT